MLNYVAGHKWIYDIEKEIRFGLRVHYGLGATLSEVPSPLLVFSIPSNPYFLGLVVLFVGWFVFSETYLRQPPCSELLGNQLNEICLLIDYLS